MAGLGLAALSRSFGGVHVIRELELTVEPGELLGVLGPNGAGKSTLFKLIAGVLHPSAGRVVYDGRDVTKIAVWDRTRMGIGLTYQIPKPFTNLSVFENVLVAAVHGGRRTVRDARREASATLERTGLARRSRDFADALSLLDLKRLELAKALVQRPRLLLLDEIAGGLTDVECEDLLGIVREVHAGGTTIVWIEHVIHVLRRIATRMAVLNDGKILVTGDPETVLADARVHEVYLGA